MIASKSGLISLLIIIMFDLCKSHKFQNGKFKSHNFRMGKLLRESNFLILK